ncbi:MAG: hypothetical protein DRR16_27090 [Candidatus Parabeggiatoa sp. nov. 3]|nr:MAG: hypothetical protein DRR16_27090 [Gammaproteobacteria bacterium]
MCLFSVSTEAQINRYFIAKGNHKGLPLFRLLLLKYLKIYGSVLSALKFHAGFMSNATGIAFAIEREINAL